MSKCRSGNKFIGGLRLPNMWLAATAMGSGAQWLTEWYGYNDKVKELLGMESHH